MKLESRRGLKRLKPNFIVIRTELSGQPRPCARTLIPFLYCGCVRCGAHVRVPVEVVTEGTMTAKLARLTMIVTCQPCFETIPEREVVERFQISASGRADEPVL